MSIEYFVEGKVSSQTEGDQLAFSKGNIAHNGIKNVLQNGTDTGVSYNNPSQVNPNDKPINTIDISLNLFFDGTQNNKTNTELGGDFDEASSDKDDSYNNEYTNVARGFDALNPSAVNQVRWYIEGIGTEDKESDSIVKGVIQGTGETGIKGKVTKGCIKGAEAVATKITDKSKIIDTLTVTVFGFSRGAAAARHFVHLVTKPPLMSYSGGKTILQIFPPEYIGAEGTFIIKDKDGSKLKFINQYGYFGACLVGKELKINKIKFRFAGLYDTVASYGLNHRGGMGIDNDTKQLGLNTIGNNKVDFVLQIAADDEYRDNFDLTNINSTGINGLEFTLPGVHSDIGGSYGNGEEISVLYCNRFDPYDQTTHKECEEFKKIVIEEGWYTEDQLKIKYFYQKDVKYDRWWNKGSQYYGLVGTRTLSNSYDKIPLNLMFHYSKQFGLEYIEDRITEDHKINDPFLSPIYNQLLGYTNQCNEIRNQYVKEYNEGRKPSATKYIKDIKSLSYISKVGNVDDLKTLRNKYLHWSVKANQIGLSPNPNNNAPKKEGALEAKYRKRNIQDG